MAEAQIEQAEKIGMSMAEFIEEFSRQPFELINGKRRDKMPEVFGPSEVKNLIFALLRAFVDQAKLGLALMETAFILPDTYNPGWVRGSRIPDAMFYTQARIDAYKAANPDYRRQPLALVPDLVIEVVSPTDKLNEVDEKIDAYLADGVKAIWVLNPERGKAVIYRPGVQPLHLAGADVLDGGDLLPGFTSQLDQLFR